MRHCRVRVLSAADVSDSCRPCAGSCRDTVIPSLPVKPTLHLAASSLVKTGRCARVRSICAG